MKKIKICVICLCSALLMSLTLQAVDLYTQVKRGAGVPVESLPSELKQLDIKDYFVSSSFKKVGITHALKRNVIVIHRGTKEAYFGKEGDAIYENDSRTPCPIPAAESCYLMTTWSPWLPRPNSVWIIMRMRERSAGRDPFSAC